MNALRTWILAGLLLVAGCSTPDSATPAPRTTPSTEQPATTTEQSAFCLDLSTFQAALLAYVAPAGRAIEGEPLDFEALRQNAGYVADFGERMLPSAPAEIAEEFRAVLAAVATSASNLREGAAPLDVVDPVYGEQNRAAFEAVETFEGCES